MSSGPETASDPTTSDKVRVSVLAPGQDLPLIVEAAVAGLPLEQWCAAHRDWMAEKILKHGGILFRGFDVPSPAHFERAAKAAWGDLFADYGDLPRNSAGEKIYESTPYPEDQMILYHNESSHLPSWPMRINFHCVTPSRTGGCTPVFDTRAVIKVIDPKVMDAFREKGLRYVRNFSPGVDPTWQAFFHTEDRSTVEQMCRDVGADFQWTPGDGLRISTNTRAVWNHPVSGEELFFNQIQLHHIACVDEETREALRELYGEEELPRNVYYGDGTPIPDEVIAHLGEVFEQVAVRFQWQKGDVIMLDNMLTTHARDPFEGERKIVVAMAQMITAEQVLGT